MALLDDMAKAIEEFKAKFPEPPQAQIKMHPDDYRELRKEAKARLSLYASEQQQPISFMGLQIVLDNDAPRPPRKPKVSQVTLQNAEVAKLPVGR